MARIPEEIIEEVLARADIESVVGKYVSFTKRTGDNLFGLCPFHSEKTPSFAVSLSKGIYRCFGCNKAGNAIKFIMEMERLTYPEAIRFLGQQYGVDIPDTGYDRGEGDLKKKKERVTDLLTEAARYYYKCFNSPEGYAAKSYAAKRGLSLKIQNNFGLGYAPEGFDKLYTHLRKMGYSDEEMRNSGLFTVSKNNGKLYDLFRGRLVFPIFDVMGKIVAFGGRAMGDEMPKYVNSPDSLVYKKQEHLYALNFAKKSRENFLMIVEGYMDTIAMHQAGFTNTVASLGTAFTDSQLRLASRYSNEIVFFFDSDKAGKAAAIRAVKMMMKYLEKMSGMNTRIKICAVPDGKDPDEFIKKNGAENFASVVRSALDVDDYLMKRAYEDNLGERDELDLYKYQEDVTEYGSWIRDDVKREKMASQAASNLRANYTTVLKQMDGKREKFLSESSSAQMRQFEKEEAEEVKKREEQATESEKKRSAFADDVAYKDELEVFVRAVRLKDKLYTDIKDKRDILTPGDFYGKNLQEAVRFFLEKSNKDYGIRESLLIETLSTLVFNGKSAENVYLQFGDSLPEPPTDKACVDMYLMCIYKLRLKRLNYMEKTLLARLMEADGREADDIKEKLQSIAAHKARLESKGDNI